MKSEEKAVGLTFSYGILETRKTLNEKDSKSPRRDNQVAGYPKASLFIL